MRIGERYVETVIFRLRAILSIEGACLATSIWASSIIADRLDLPSPLFLRLFRPELYALYRIGMVVIIFMQMFIIYGVGELIRKKFKLKSILFFDTKNEKIKQQIIELMKGDPNVGIGDIADVVGLYPGHTEAYIRALKKSGQICSEGWWKNRRWNVNDEHHSQST